MSKALFTLLWVGEGRVPRKGPGLTELEGLGVSQTESGQVVHTMTEGAGLQENPEAPERPPWS